MAGVHLAWHLFAESPAPGATATSHTRVVQGAARTVVRQPKKVVSNGAKATGTVLLKLARKGAERLVGTPALWSTVLMTDTGVAELPALYTNGRELGAQRGVTDRTIRTHIQELKAAGLITRYKYRGTNASYCLWINPNFVWEKPLVTAEGGKNSPPETPFLEAKRKNLPLIELPEALEAPKSEISEVQMLVGTRGPAETGSPLTRSAGCPSDCQPAAQASKSGAGAARRATFYRQAQERGAGAKKAEAKKLVEAFWLYAKTLIYKGKTFNEEAERQAKNAIWQGVFHGFAEGEPADWLAWMPGLQRRVELAADWLARNPSNWAPAPYAEVIAGQGYFDAGNQRGFARTERWWRDEQAHHGQGALERALDEALTELRQWRARKAGQPRVQASKRVKQKDFSELHRYHHTKLRRMGGDEALRRFAARLEAEQILTLSA